MLGTPWNKSSGHRPTGVRLECADNHNPTRGCVLKKWMLALPAAGLAAAVAPAVYAHFKLLEPATWLAQDDRGDPQTVSYTHLTLPTKRIV